jgi:hypothetical protein
MTNKGGVRGEGTVGRLLAMVWVMGGDPVRRGRGAEDGGARPACPREEDEGGVHTSGREERGRPAEGHWAGGPAQGRGEVGHSWVKNWRWAKIQK